MLPASSTPWKPATTTTLPAVEVGADFLLVDREDARLGVRAVGEDPHLRAGVAARLHALLHQRHRKQRDRDLLAGGHHDVELARVRVRLNVLRERDQAVGLARHRRDDDDELVPARLPVRDAARDVLDALGAADGSAAVLLDDQSHG